MFAQSIPRIVRLLLAIVVLLVVLTAVAVGALFYMLDEKAVKKTIDAYALEALDAIVEYGGPVEVKHLTSLKVRIPALRFADRESGETIGSIASAEADVALWSALLGAVNVNSVTIDGARLKLHVPSLNGNAVYDQAFGAVRFPDNLRVSQFRLQRSSIDLTTGTQDDLRAWTVSNLTLSTGRLSPEMTTPFEFAAHFAAAKKAPVVPAPAPAAEQAPAPETGPAAAAEAPVPAPEAQPAESQEAAPAPAEAPAAAAPEPSAYLDAPQQAAPESAESTPAPQPPAQAPEDQESAPEPQAPKIILKPEEGTVTFGFLRQAYAADALPAAAGTFLSFDPDTTEGDVSAKGTITISVTDRYVMLENVALSGELADRGEVWTAVAKADRLRFKGTELSGSNLTASVSKPADTTGDIHLGAVDFRLRPGVLESPEMRVARTEERDGRVNTFEASSSVRADLVKGTADLDNLTARVSITGDPNLPTDFNASVSGFIKADLAGSEGEVGLSGNFAGAPISFNGTVRNAAQTPVLEGELMIGEINRDTLPGAEMLAWMRHFDFKGGVRIGSVTAGGMNGTQLNGRLTVDDGRALIDSLVINTAEGRLFGTFELAEDTSWLFKGRADGVSLEKFIASAVGASPVAGIADGDFTLSGKSFAPESLAGTASLRVLRAAYIGIDTTAARSHLVSNADAALITRQGARSDFDEASLSVTLSEQRLTLSNIVARSVYVRAKTDASVDLSAGSVQGASSLTFAPQQGVPTIHLASSFAGKATAPVWTFEWDKAAEALRRAQGRPAASDKKEGRSIWQSVRDFFSF